MERIQENMKRGAIELLILHLLMKEDMYGYQLTQELEERSSGLFVIREGTMYPSLYLLIERGLISDRREIVGKRRTRIYYHIEESGIEYYNRLLAEYNDITLGITKVLESK